MAHRRSQTLPYVWSESGRSCLPTNDPVQGRRLVPVQVKTKVSRVLPGKFLPRILASSVDEHRPLGARGSVTGHEKEF